MSDTSSLILRDSEIDAAFNRKSLFWRFGSLLEAQFETYRYQRILKFVMPIGWSALALFAVYSLLDALLFPRSVYAITILIRLSLICPLIGLMMWLSQQNLSSRRFMTIYTLAFFAGGLGILGIILAARLENMVLPYDGLLLFLMFGYSLMALPVLWVCSAGMSLSLLYIVMEIAVDFPRETLMYNASFLITANIIGMVGCILHEHSLRTQFLNQTLIQRSREALWQENQAKTRLLASASHDLRQPLHAMTLLAEDLEQRLPAGREAHCVQQLQKSILNLNQLLGSVLDISRMSVGILQPVRKRIDLTRLGSELVEETQNRAATQQVSLRWLGPSGAEVYSDPVLLSRILRNLLENALTHSQASRIILSWRKVGDYYRVLVSDNGIGIPAHEQSRVFDEFSRIAGTPSTGLGLGLSIVKQLSHQLGLPLGLQSLKEQGTTFWVDVPLYIPRSETDSSPSLHPDGDFVPPDTESALENTEIALSPASDPASPSGDATRAQTTADSEAVRIKVLVIDDEQDILNAMAALLEHWGFEVQTCARWADIETRLAHWQPQIVISDYHLTQGVNGLQLITQLRQRWSHAIPALIITADTDLDPEFIADENTLLSHKPLPPVKLRLMLKHLAGRL